MASYCVMPDKGDLYATIFAELKCLGVKVPKIKKFKSSMSKRRLSISEKGCKIFGVCLGEQEWISEGEYPLPKFIALATAYLQRFINKEIGLFRKAGNVARQKRLRARLERGESFQDSDPNDVASLLKQWLRELPEPLIPSYLQDLFIRCQNLDSEHNRISACKLSFLLLPPDHLHTLKHLLKFLASMALSSKENRMGTYNLALIMAPNIFTSNERMDKSKNNLVYQHTAIMQSLIENSDKIGEIPPSLAVQEAILGAELNSSADQVDSSSSKPKKKFKNRPVQDIMSGFRKLVGQNLSLSSKNVASEDVLKTPVLPRSASKRKADPEPIISTTKKKKHTVSLDNLDSPSRTPANKDIFLDNERSSSGHTRRRSFGALLLRRKEKKRPEKQSLQVDSTLPDANVNSEKTNKDFYIPKSHKTDIEETKFQFNTLNINPSVKKEEMSFQSSSDTNRIKGNFLPIIPPASHSNKPLIKYSKSCKYHTENKPQNFKSGLPSKIHSSTSNEKQTHVELLSCHRSGLSRQEAFSIKSNKNKSHASISEVKIHENKDTKVKTKGITENPSSTCVYSQSSICNIKCDKNKTSKTERTSEKQTKRGSVKERQTVPHKTNMGPGISTRTVESDDFVRSSKTSSRSSSTKVTPPLTRPEHSDSVTIVDKSEPQSLDLSLSLLLQNFCMSPPNKSPEIRLSIGITSNNNSEVKLNFSNEALNKQSKMALKSAEVSGVSKTRNRLSSNSDSRIPRLKKYAEISRPNSFSGSFAGCRRMVKIEKGGATTKYFSKIPTMLVESENEVISPRDRSTDDSSFKTPNTTFNSASWKSGSQYLSAMSSPDEGEQVPNKRESIARILKEYPGHVQAKVNLYDSKLQSSGSSNCSSHSKRDRLEDGKLVRSSSEKYPSSRRYNRSKLTSTNSYDSVSKGFSLRPKPAFHRPALQSLPKFTLSSADTPSQNESNSMIDEVFSENSFL